MLNAKTYTSVDSSNPFACSQVVNTQATGSDDEFQLARPIQLEGKGSLETAIRAVWETYGQKDRIRFWLWLSLLWAVLLYGLFSMWSSWWLAILAATVAFSIYVGLIVPARIVRSLRHSAAHFDLLYRGEVTDTSLELLKQTADGEWVEVIPDKPVVAWRDLQLLNVGADYFLFLMRAGERGWLLSLPRQFFATDRDWSDMVDFADRRLLRPFVAPRCAKCRRRLPRSALRPMPPMLRLLVGQPFSSLGLLFGVPSAGFCVDCWTTVYRRQIAAFVVVVAVTICLIALVTYRAFALR